MIERQNKILEDNLEYVSKIAPNPETGTQKTATLFSTFNKKPNEKLAYQAKGVWPEKKDVPIKE